MLSDQTGSRKSKMAASKPEVLRSQLVVRKNAGRSGTLDGGTLCHGTIISTMIDPRLTGAQGRRFFLSDIGGCKFWGQQLDWRAADDEMRFN